ncbi:MAG: peptidoglycan-binding protein [Candidatus Omnitrophica bacterium]|nr:peptidoglycan-binding protein [Candidatus Omnitrophota bacterium]
MKRYSPAFFAFLILALSAVGCSKKSVDQASLSTTGMGPETLSSTAEEMAQLPQATTAMPQQAGIETLPIEAAPVTPGAPGLSGSTAALAEAASTSAAAATSAGNLSYHQKIQTALKSAGFYSGNVDGKIGPASKKAIEAFQKANNLKADGKVGSKTWAVLERYLNGSTEEASVSPTTAASTAKKA